MTARSISWGHTVRPLTGEEIVGAAGFGRTCSAGKCGKAPTYRAAYCYVTGRAGRTTNAVRFLCGEHADRFAARHGLDVKDGESQ